MDGVAHSPIEYEYLLNRSIWPRDETLIGATSLGHSGPGSNANEEALNSTHISRAGSLQSDGV